MVVYVSVFSFHLPYTKRVPGLDGEQLFPVEEKMLLLFLQGEREGGLPFFSMFPGKQDQGRCTYLLVMGNEAWQSGESVLT